MAENKITEIKDYLWELQSDFEKELIMTDNVGKVFHQSAIVYHRISQLLNIYRQIIEDGQVFDEAYLKCYLGGNYGRK